MKGIQRRVVELALRDDSVDGHSADATAAENRHLVQKHHRHVEDVSGRFIILAKAGQRELEVTRVPKFRIRIQGARVSRWTMAFSYQSAAKSGSERTAW